MRVVKRNIKPVTELNAPKKMKRVAAPKPPRTPKPPLELCCRT
jgi:hypothetical protein